MPLAPSVVAFALNSSRLGLLPFLGVRCGDESTQDVEVVLAEEAEEDDDVFCTAGVLASAAKAVIVGVTE